LDRDAGVSALDADLIAYYEAEARGGHRSAYGDLRVDLRRRFAELLRNEHSNTLLDVGAGPGLDTARWDAEGFGVVGLDLTHANVEHMREVGLTGITGSLYHLPFRAAAFDALWTMSTFVHVPHDRFDEAIVEMLRVVEPGAPLGIGTWGGLDFEGVPEFGELRPYRFFSLATHDRWHSMLARHAEVELFETYESAEGHGWEYQFAVVRTKLSNSSGVRMPRSSTAM
jgi:ubiquinone/menaquinone biosynthesis C-methylase UbiE